jgi:hypothetical protein
MYIIVVAYYTGIKCCYYVKGDRCAEESQLGMITCLLEFELLYIL